MSNNNHLRGRPYICLVGAAGSGKSTVANLLLRDRDVKLDRVVTTTSRTPRTGEVPGDSYHFVSRDSFMEMVASGAFFEWEETHGNCYGTTYAALQAVTKVGKSPLLIVDIRGALSFKKRFPAETVIVFLTPSSSEHLLNRLRGRGDTEEQCNVRMATAAREYAMFIESQQEIEYVVINDVLEDAVASVEAILRAEECRTVRLSEVALAALRVSD